MLEVVLLSINFSIEKMRKFWQKESLKELEPQNQVLRTQKDLKNENLRKIIRIFWLLLHLPVFTRYQRRHCTHSNDLCLSILHLIIIYNSAIGGVSRLNPFRSKGIGELIAVVIVSNEVDGLLFVVDGNISHIGLHERILTLAFLVAVGLAGEKYKGKKVKGQKGKKLPKYFHLNSRNV